MHNIIPSVVCLFCNEEILYKEADYSIIQYFDCPSCLATYKYSHILHKFIMICLDLKINNQVIYVDILPYSQDSLLSIICYLEEEVLAPPRYLLFFKNDDAIEFISFGINKIVSKISSIMNFI